MAVQPTAEADRTVCLGVNADPTCSHAAKPIPVYSNQYVNVQCSNCYMGIEATLFADIKIGSWRLQQLAGGLKDIAVKGTVELVRARARDCAAGADDRRRRT
jgi:hypothetical protein